MTAADLLESLMRDDRERDRYQSRWHLKESVVNQRTGKVLVRVWCDDVNRGVGIDFTYDKDTSPEDYDRMMARVTYLVELHNEQLARMVIL
jgi:hypothetical protein